MRWKWSARWALPFTRLQKPRPVARIAGGFPKVILVDGTRPVGVVFAVRIFDEDEGPSKAEVVSAYVYHGAPVPAVGRCLEAA